MMTNQFQNCSDQELNHLYQDILTNDETGLRPRSFDPYIQNILNQTDGSLTFGQGWNYAKTQFYEEVARRFFPEKINDTDKQNHTKIIHVLQNYYAQASQHHDILFVALYGSQHYGYDTPDSDIDAYAAYLPTLSQLYFEMEPDSMKRAATHTHTLTFPTGICVCKDIRDMFENYLKQSISFCETLTTPYVIWNPKYKDLLQRFLFKYESVITNCDPKQQVRTTFGQLAACQTMLPKTDDDFGKVTARAFFLYQFLQKRIMQNLPFKEALPPTDEERQTMQLIRNRQKYQTKEACLDYILHLIVTARDMEAAWLAQYPISDDQTHQHNLEVRDMLANTCHLLLTERSKVQ